MTLTPLLFIVRPVFDGGTPARAKVRSYFVTPEDVATVASPVKVVFGLSGMGIAPTAVAKDNTRHHHLIVDAPLPDLSKPIPNDPNHRHFGGGQTETTIELTPGTHFAAAG